MYAKTMRPEDFRTGMRFYNPSGHWECSDIGTPTIVAIRLDAPDESWYAGPTYAVAECVMDENHLVVCLRTYEKAYAVWGDDFARNCRRKASIHDEPLDPSQDVYTVPRIETAQLSSELRAYLETQKFRYAHVPLLETGKATGWTLVYTGT